MNNRYISWRRVSTKKQGKSGLGLDAQKQIIDYFVELNKGELIADYSEQYTGTELNGCTELRKAIQQCKRDNAVLIIAKTDRFRNTIEALQIYEEMGENNILFCDLPHTDKFMLTLFFSLAEREALLVSIRTKQALRAKKERGEVWNKNNVVSKKTTQASREARLDKAKNNPNNLAFWEFITDYQKICGKITANTDFKPIAEELNKRGKKTSTGLEFNANRARAMYHSLKNSIYNE